MKIPLICVQKGSKSYNINSSYVVSGYSTVDVQMKNGIGMIMPIRAQNLPTGSDVTIATITDNDYLPEVQTKGELWDITNERHIPIKVNTNGTIQVYLPNNEPTNIRLDGTLIYFTK